LSLLLGATTLESAPSVAHGSKTFRSEGKQVTLTFDDGRLEGTMMIVRGGSVEAPETFLVYVIIDRVTGFQLQEGSGVIPNSAFTADADNARLTVDTSTVPDFALFTGSGVRFDVTWTENGLFSERREGSSVTETPGLRIKSKGSSFLKTADAQGTLNGHAITGVSEATIGINDNKTITVEY
jgi:hypothetical protein